MNSWVVWPVFPRTSIIWSWVSDVCNKQVKSSLWRANRIVQDAHMCIWLLERTSNPTTFSIKSISGAWDNCGISSRMLRNENNRVSFQSFWRPKYRLLRRHTPSRQKESSKIHQFIRIHLVWYKVGMEGKGAKHVLDICQDQQQLSFGYCPVWKRETACYYHIFLKVTCHYHMHPNASKI